MRSAAVPVVRTLATVFNFALSRGPPLCLKTIGLIYGFYGAEV